MIDVGLMPHRAHNAKARAENAHVTSMNEMLEPLLDKNKQEVAEFPVDGTQLRYMTGRSPPSHPHFHPNRHRSKLQLCRPPIVSAVGSV